MRREEGFTLIELSFALGIFAIVLVSLTLVFDTALETATRVRSDELSKTLAQQKLEEIRSLPFHVSQKENTGDVDVLDRYFPDDVSLGANQVYDGTANVWTFTTTEPAATADGRSYLRTVAVRFVVPKSDGTLLPVAPIAGYDSNIADADTPAADAVHVSVTTSRTVAGQNRSVNFDTVMVRTQETQPSVEASAQVEAVNISGVGFQDGDDGIAAEILATVAETELAFREVTGSTSQASGDPLDVLERDPATNSLVQNEAPTGGNTSASVPNSTDGDVQSAPSGTLGAAGSMGSTAGVGAIAGWGSSNPSATADARISKLHTLNPEGRATAWSSLLDLNARDTGEAVPLRMVEFGDVTTSAEQRSTTTSSAIEADVRLEPVVVGSEERPGAAVFASRGFRTNPEYRGVVRIQSMSVDGDVSASAAASTSILSWRVDGLRVWDPDANGGLGGYGPSYTFGFTSGCGGWVGSPPATCPTGQGTPNPVVLPAAYVGPGGETSLEIMAGVTIADASGDPAAGFTTATASQKNVLIITTKDDVAGASPLEPMTVVLGIANLSVSYVGHEH
jgi:prepilin-type N-terminal cleavage/methylation domain-containing protein